MTKVDLLNAGNELKFAVMKDLKGFDFIAEINRTLNVEQALISYLKKEYPIRSKFHKEDLLVKKLFAQSRLNALLSVFLEKMGSDKAKNLFNVFFKINATYVNKFEKAPVLNYMALNVFFLNSSECGEKNLLDVNWYESVVLPLLLLLEQSVLSENNIEATFDIGNNMVYKSLSENQIGMFK